MSSDEGRPTPADIVFGFNAVRPRNRAGAPASEDASAATERGAVKKDSGTRRSSKSGRESVGARGAAGEREFAADLDIGMDNLVGELCGLLSGDVVRAKMPQGLDKVKKTIFIPTKAVAVAEKMAKQTGSTANSLYYLMFLAGADAIRRAYDVTGRDMDAADEAEG